VLHRPEPAKWWSVTPEWQGQIAFLVGGGPSVLSQDLELLRGRHVIAINSSYQRVPFADILFFGDLRWWLEHRVALDRFAGRIVTCRPNVPCDLTSGGRSIFSLQRQNPPGLATIATRVMFRRTSYASAINLAVHLGVQRIVTLGLDGQAAPNGRTHHHEQHKWVRRADSWREQRKDFATLVEPLKAAGVELLNASPGSAVPFWPIVDLKDFV
jgi:hypothetical protein